MKEGSGLPQGSANGSAQPMTTVTGARVLVVDDVAENRDLLVRRLARLGITKVEEAENGQLALDKLEPGRFDLVLLDIMMPVMTGYEVLQRLNAEGRTHDLPVIVISALSEVDDIANCIEEGAEDFLLKPFNRTLLRARVLSSLEKKFLRDRTREELQRKQAELAEARILQLALAPPPGRLETALGPIVIDLVLDPAKEVGGDLVDHFPIGERLHVLVLGDVSDKGAGAALMMARTSALFRSLAGRQDAALLFGAPERAMAEVNNVLSANNPSCMFVTLLLATLELTTGRLHYVRAGHVPPFLRHADGRIDRLEHAGGFPLGVMEDAVYSAAIVDLVAGDCFLSVTDGVSEAAGSDNVMFGEEAIAQWFAAPGHEPPRVLDLVAEVRRHEGGAPPSDDVAIILLQLLGQQPAASLTETPELAGAPELAGELLLTVTVSPNPEPISALVEQVLAQLEERAVDTRAAHHAALALDELLTNLGSHGSASSCRVWLALTPEQVSVAIEDDGQPFDPRQLPAPDTGADLESRAIGGLGAHLVLSFARSFDYRSAGGRNLTSLTIARAARP